MKWMSFIHLKVITKLLTKKRINNCNHQPLIIQKGDNLMKTTNTKIIITKKRRKQTINGKRNLQNKKL